MSVRDELRDEIEKVPDALAAEVLDFVRLLKAKVATERFELALASRTWDWTGLAVP